MGLSKCWRCPSCGLALPWSEEKSIEDHDCAIIYDCEEDYLDFEEPRQQEYYE